MSDRKILQPLEPVGPGGLVERLRSKVTRCGFPGEPCRECLPCLALWAADEIELLEAAVKTQVKEAESWRTAKDRAAEWAIDVQAERDAALALAEERGRLAEQLAEALAGARPWTPYFHPARERADAALAALRSHAALDSALGVFHSQKEAEARVSRWEGEQ